MVGASRHGSFERVGLNRFAGGGSADDRPICQPPVDEISQPVTDRAVGTKQARVSDIDVDQNSGVDAELLAELQRLVGAAFDHASVGDGCDVGVDSDEVGPDGRSNRERSLRFRRT